MKNSKGITLVSLVITIIVLLLLASIATYSGLNVIRSSKFTTFTTQLKIMQTKVNALYQENSQKEYGVVISGDLQAQANKIFAELSKDTQTGITSQEGYRYWDKNVIKELGIEGVEQDFFINLEKRSVISCQGFKEEGKTYYTLSQIPNGLYNVEYVQPTSDKPTFEVEVEAIDTDKWSITISHIQYDGYIDKWQVKYQLEGNSYWNTSDDLTFVVKEEGNYKIKLVNGDIVSDEKTKYLGYAKGGLQLYYDGIHNTRSGNNPNTTIWEDLSENKNDGILYNMNTQTGYYSADEKGYVFLENASYIESKNNIGISGDSLYTTEVVMKPWEQRENSQYLPYHSSTPFFWGTTTDSTVGKSYMMCFYRENLKFGIAFVNNSILSDNSFNNVINQISSVSFRKTKTGQIKNGDTNVGTYHYNGKVIPATYTRNSIFYT